MCSNRKKNIVNRSKQIKWLVSLYNVLPTLKVCLHSVMIIKFAYALHFLSVLFEFNSNISDSHWFLCWKRMNVVCCDLVVRAAQNSRVSINHIIILTVWLRVSLHFKWNFSHLFIYSYRPFARSARDSAHLKLNVERLYHVQRLFSSTTKTITIFIKQRW